MKQCDLLCLIMFSGHQLTSVFQFLKFLQLFGRDGQRGHLGPPLLYIIVQNILAKRQPGIVMLDHFHFCVGAFHSV